MKKSYINFVLPIVVVFIVSVVLIKNKTTFFKTEKVVLVQKLKPKTSKKTIEEAYLNTLERELHEFNFQKNPQTGQIPLEEKKLELQKALQAKQQALLGSFANSSTNTYISRGPTNLGGRTRALKVDLSDNTSNTMLAGGVSSGLFRTINGGDSWVKVSPNDEIHNVTALAQDPRPGFQNVWYYGTGEWFGNSASLGDEFRGQGIWQSTDGGLTWTQIAATDSDQTVFDSAFDFVHNLQVSPVTGELFVAAAGIIYRYDGTTFNQELSQIGPGFTDVTIASNGTVYASLDNSSIASRGVWTSSTGNGSWARIAQNNNPSGWSSGGNARTVLATSGSNPDIMYALYNNGQSGGIEAGLWRYNASTNTWTDFSSKLPDEPGGDLFGNDPFAIQGAYNLVINVKPNDENFVVIGGTNAYKISDINNDTMFSRIGGFANVFSYALYPNHHPDIHVMEFDPFNASGNILFTGDDGGIHKTLDVNASNVFWESLNNNYQTFQFYHIALNPTSGSDGVAGGTQDNGTVVGGSDFGLPDNSTMFNVFGGDGVAVGIAPRNNGADIQGYLGSQFGNAITNYPFDRTITPSGSSSQFVTYFYLDPENTNAIYYAGLSTLYASSDAENVTQFNWNNLGPLPTGENIRTFATSPGSYNPATSYLFIGGESGGLFRLADPQNATNAFSATNITPAGASTLFGTVLSGIAIHPTNPDIMMAVYANYGIQNIFLTTNATAPNPTWTLAERNLDSHSIRSVAISEVGGETNYFVGTARGLYRSMDPLTTDWSIEGQTTIGLAVVSGLVYRHADKRLLVGTHGNGMFETTIQTLSTANIDSNTFSFSIYPNPASTVINIEVSNVSTNRLDYSIYNITGHLVDEGTTNDKNINVEALSSGMYILKLVAEGISTSTKFIKE